ncbi:ORF6N domain-containing protein [Roseospira visakhapatnamensis]|uniref:KilA-N DNA-binding domain-containing protein n=1 Tax=Roseospira visakhapatnamensis TaxID=390880 RepID=A0A7W6RGP8_9PROT|nr:ORF6N domain-containing protein [Roseospira visakhapatnamensis]MBB4268132.1 hypothetical protein [Roseospira visakhapatnamensis]
MTHTTLAPVPVAALRPVTYRGEPVLTTEILAAAYGTETVRIRQNMTRNADRFVEGKHYFKITGDELRMFRDRTEYLKDTPFAPGSTVSALILWTQRGAARHAKMLETDAAWEVFEALEDSYFDRREGTGEPAARRFNPSSGEWTETRPGTESRRFWEEMHRLGFADTKALAEAGQLSRTTLWHFTQGNMVPKKGLDMLKLIGLGFDLRYLLYGERTFARAELDLIAAYRDGDTAGVQRIVAERPPRLTDQTDGET